MERIQTKFFMLKRVMFFRKKEIKLVPSSYCCSPNDTMDVIKRHKTRKNLVGFFGCENYYCVIYSKGDNSKINDIWFVCADSKAEAGLLFHMFLPNGNIIKLEEEQKIYDV